MRGAGRGLVLNPLGWIRGSGFCFKSHGTQQRVLSRGPPPSDRCCEWLILAGEPATGGEGGQGDRHPRRPDRLPGLTRGSLRRALRSAHRKLSRCGQPRSRPPVTPARPRRSPVQRTQSSKPASGHPTRPEEQSQHARAPPSEAGPAAPLSNSLWGPWVTRPEEPSHTQPTGPWQKREASLLSLPRGEPGVSASVSSGGIPTGKRSFRHPGREAYAAVRSRASAPKPP